MIKPDETNILFEIIKSPVLSALIGAVVASLLSPYLKWGIEKKLNISHFEKDVQDNKTLFYYEGLTDKQWNFVIKTSRIFDLSIFNFNPDGKSEFYAARKVIIRKNPTNK